ncbi:TPA: hypothetical protein HA246_01290 [Candidatus Woesearchaeota archaeon]|nr:hypothetical protein [Candidatus Woesearchaeota archaeon]
MTSSKLFDNKKHSKKAEVASQIFVYIIALVVVGMVIVFGYKAVKSFASRSDEVALIKFKTEVENTFKQVSSNFNTIKVEDFDIPSGYEEICIVNLNAHQSISEFTYEEFERYNPILYEGVQEKKNLFLVNGIYIEPFNVGKVALDIDTQTSANKPDACNGDGKENPTADDGYLMCIKSKNSKVRMKLKGKGDKTFVSCVQ